MRLWTELFVGVRGDSTFAVNRLPWNRPEEVCVGRFVDLDKTNNSIARKERERLSQFYAKVGFRNGDAQHDLVSVGGGVLC